MKQLKVLTTDSAAGSRILIELIVIYIFPPVLTVEDVAGFLIHTQAQTGAPQRSLELKRPSFRFMGSLTASSLLKVSLLSSLCFLGTLVYFICTLTQYLMATVTLSSPLVVCHSSSYVSFQAVSVPPLGRKLKFFM